MAKITSNFSALLGRLLKGIVVAVLIPFAIGLLQGITQGVTVASASGSTALEWMWWGFVTYVGIHLLLYRPAGLFRASHALFSVLAVWLFGGQVASVESAGGGKHKSGKGEGSSQGSTLVAFSPYVIPLYVILVSAAAWGLRQAVDPKYVDGASAFLIGAASAFHWLMTAEDLQQQRERWRVETYLLAIGLVFMVTLLIGGACLPLAVPEFSFVPALSDGLARAQAIYAALIQRLFL